MTTTNEKKLTRDVVKRDAPHLIAVLDDVIEVVRVVLNEVSNEVQKGNKVLLKNFGTFELEDRKPRPRYDTGKKQVVTTEPALRIKFVQSPNIFRDGKDD